MSPDGALRALVDPIDTYAAAQPVPGVSFRRANSRDVAVIHALVGRAYAHYVPILGYAPGPMRRDYAIQLAANPVWLAEAGNAIAGLLELIVEADGIVVEDLAVDPDFQGRGLGSWFMAFAEHFARANGRHVMRTYTNQNMERNIAIYRHLGYRETHRATTEGIPRVFLEKQLSGEM
jgi:GNAT superfamily N-acetyltransferase